jgi:signal transduction histidine kinase
LSGRLTVELRLFGLLGLTWLLSAAHALAWAWLTMGFGPELPIAMLVLPQAVAITVAGVALYFDLPAVRWRGRTRRPSPWPLLVAGFPLAPFAALLVARDRRARAAPPPDAELVERAFQQLLRLPRTLGLRFLTWATLAGVVDVLVLGRSLDWNRDAFVLMSILWVSLLGPTAAVLVGAARAMVRPEYLTAPRRAPPFRQTADLQLRIAVRASITSAGAIVAPLCIAHLWFIANEGVAGSPAVPKAAFVFGAIMIGAATITAAVLLGRVVRRDVVRAAERTQTVIDGAKLRPAVEGSFGTQEIRELAASVDRLVERITEANIAKYIAIEKAREVDRLKSQFLANMSHDLRSPLNSILGFSELLLSGIDGELGEEQREMIATILVNGRSLLREIDDILDTAKIEAARLDLHPEPTPPATLVNRAIHGAKKRKGSHVRYVVNTAAGLPPAFCDPYRTVQAIENVLLFASERMDEGSIEIKLRLGKTERGRMIFVQVFTPVRPATADQLARARRGFFRIPGHRGLGLGLPIAGSILELEGGALGIEDLDEGMIFTLQLCAPDARPRIKQSA